MRKIFFIIFIFLININLTVSAGSYQNKREFVLDDQQHPTQALNELFDLFDIKYNEDFEEMVNKTQEKWRRSKERWLEEEKYSAMRQDLLPIFDRLGCIASITPVFKRYEYALIYGALCSRVRSRLSFLVNEWNKGIRFDTLVFLGGDRDLEKDFETAELLQSENKILPIRADFSWSKEFPKNETEMMKFIYEQADLPEGMRNVKVIFVDAPKKLVNGVLKRPDTLDTLVEWLKDSPKSGKCLFVSNQPYVGYQDAVARSIMPSSYFIETIGEKASDNLIMNIYLDTVAKWLYFEYLSYERQNELFKKKFIEFAPYRIIHMPPVFRYLEETKKLLENNKD